jgi:hypothetical protein
MPGETYQLVVYARSTISGTFNNSRSAIVTMAASDPQMAVDAPVPGGLVTMPFLINGWAIDRAAASGTGVDAVHVWAYPNPGSGLPAVFLGVASYGGTRGDVGSVFGAQFTNSGFFLTITSLSPGAYRLVVYAHSTVSATFNDVRTADVMVSVSNPVMSIDAPVAGAHVGGSFAIAGWAIDRGALSGSGVDAINVWGYPVMPDGSYGAPMFVAGGNAGGSRPDVGSVYGSQFTSSGYNLVASGLSSGTYDLVVYAHSTVTGTFNESLVVRIITP